MDGASQVTGSSDILEYAQPESSQCWNDDTRDFVVTSLALNDDSSTVSEGGLLIVNPDESAICAEEFPGVTGSQIEVEHCEELYSDLLVEVESTSATSGTLTYLFQSMPVLRIGYSENTDLFEIDLTGIRVLSDAEVALDPTNNADTGGPFDEYTGIIRLSSSSSNTAVGEET